MKLTVLLGISLTLVVSSGVAFAGSADDIKWVSQCLDDNKDSGKPLEVVKVYCECMNDKMPESETKSITQWEKSHPKEEAECDKKAGWK